MKSTCSSRPRLGRTRLLVVPALFLALAAPGPSGSQGAPAEGAPGEPALWEGGRVEALTRPGDGRPVAGLGAGFHVGRRAALREALGEGLVLVRGLQAAREYERFRQDKTFWYLTGVASPDAALVMDAASGEEWLFLPEPNPMLESWEGEIWDSGDVWVRELTGIAEVRPGRSLLAFLEERSRPGAVLWISRYPTVITGGAADRSGPYKAKRRADPLDGRPSREDALAAALQERFAFEVRDCRRMLERLRWTKTPEELDALRRASESAARAMVDAIRITRPGMGEWELAARMTYVHTLEGGSGPAYYPIVGSGPNSCVLHYNDISRRLRTGEVVLVDYAPEVDGYVSDVTRTWPVDERFSERAAQLYDIVLESQLAGIAAVRPGATFADVERACNAVFARHGVMDLRLHAATHTVGMEVHDTNVRLSALTPGVVLTVEPGLYDRRAGIGIRIEDVVAVTEDGHEVLSASVPKTRAEIEALRAEGLRSAR